MNAVADSGSAQRARAETSAEQSIVLAPGVNTSLHCFDGNGAGSTVMMIVPALGVPARSYLRLGAALAQRGLHALVLDLRGVGSSSVRARRGLDWGYLDLVDDELRALWSAAQQRHPRANKVWVGHSLGGHLSVLHQARHADQPVASLAFCASGTPWYRHYRGVYRYGVRAFGAFARASSRALGVFRGDLLGFGGAQGARLMREWGDFCTRGRLPALGDEGWDPYPALAAIERHKFALSMAGDHYAPADCTEHLASLINGPLRLHRMERLPSGRHPGHFDWMREPEAVAEHLADHCGAD